MMQKFVKVYDEWEAKVLVGSLVFTVLLIFSQIIARTFGSSLSWSEELARYIFIWQIWLGMSIGLKDNKHIHVEMLYQFIKGRPARVMKIIVTILCIVLCGVLVYYGGIYTQNALKRGTLSAALRMPLWWVYLALPFSSLITGLRYACQLWTQLKNFGAPDAEAIQAH
ncbi:TRAP transporter small permease [Desulfovibrio sp. OttesenSCG-928-I05]|nr:TRAP transporter small permease [Desulfovibrio sp. OttesenSCG-928-I05]